MVRKTLKMSESDTITNLVLMGLFSFDFLPGKANMIWPGLNTPVIKGRQVIDRQRLPPNKDFQQQLVEIRDKSTKMTYESRPPILRGWSGKGMAGVSIGPPDPIGDCKTYIYLFERLSKLIKTCLLWRVLCYDVDIFIIVYQYLLTLFYLICS